MQIPKDPYILLSFVNTKLRDEFVSLEDLSRSLQINQETLETTMSAIDYLYNPDTNQFISQN